MKTLSTIMVMLMTFTIGSAFAAHNYSTMNLSVPGKADVVVVLDGERLNSKYRDFHIDHLRPGAHHLKVIRIKEGYYGHRERVVIFNERIHIPAGKKLNATVSGRHGFVINSAMALHHRPHRGHGHAYGKKGGKYGYGNTAHGRTCSSESGYGYGVRALSKQEFEHLLYDIKDQAFEDSRLRIAQRAIRNHYFTSRQVKRLMMNMAFEDSRLVIAKNAASKVVDPELYYVVEDAFAFQSSIDRLARFLARH